MPQEVKNQYVFFSTQDLEDKISLEDSIADRLRRVLRVSEGKKIILFLGNGQYRAYEISRIQKEEILCSAVDKVQQKEPISSRRSLAIGILKNPDKMKWIVQKATEIGVEEIHWIQMDNSQPRWSQKDWEKKKRSYQLVLTQAMEQSGMFFYPKLFFWESLPEALTHFQSSEDYVLWVCKENEGDLSPQIKTEMHTQQQKQHLGLIAPEGGFSEVEMHMLDHLHLPHLGLSSYILRSETAALMFLAYQSLWAGEAKFVQSNG